MIIADILGHELIQSKRDADAHAIGNPEEKYEYLSCKEGGSGQLDGSRNAISHVGFSIRWASRNGRIVYEG